MTRPRKEGRFRLRTFNQFQQRPGHPAQKRRAEEALRQSEAKYRELVQSANSVIIRWKCDGTLVFFNEYAQSLFGYSADEVIGKDVRMLVPKEESSGGDLTGLIEDIVARPAHYVNNVNENVCRDGRRIWLAWTNKPVYDAQGRVAEILAVAVDITARKRAEEALRGSEVLLKESQIIAGVGSYVLDIATGMFTSSEALDRLFGIDAAYERSVDGWTALIHPNDRTMMAEYFRDEVLGKGQTFDKEYRIVSRDSQGFRWVHGLGKLEFDAQHRPVRMLGTIREITERKRAEDALRQSHDRMKKVLEVETVGVMFWDLATGRMTDANDTFLKMMGYSRRDVEAGELTWQKLTPPEYHEASLAEIRKFQATGRVGPYEKEYLRKDGTRQWLVFAGSSLGANACVEFCVDISARKRAEEALLRSEDQLRRAQEIAHLGSWDLDLVANRLTWSDEVYRLFGLQPQEFEATYEAFLEQVHPDDRATVHEAYSGSLRENRDTYEVEHRIVRKDTGEIRIVHERCQHVRDATGKIVRSGGMVHDITERKQAEEALHKRAEEALRMSEQEFRSLAEAMPQIVWATRADGWNIYFNRKWVDYTGMTMEESYGHGWNTPLHPDDKQRAWDAWQRATQHNERYSLECRIRRHDGVYRWWLVRGEPMRGANGEILKWFGTCTDIEEIKNAEAALKEANDLLERRVAERTAALRESEQRYRAIGESIDYGVWICAPDGRNIYASPSFLKLVGLTQEQCSSFGWGEVLHPGDAERTIAAWKECVRTGGTWDIEHRFRGVDGQWHPVLARGVPVRNDGGEIVCWAGINLDISRIKRTELELVEARSNAEEANRQKDHFLAVLGHELRNPLSPIRNSVALLKRAGPFDPLFNRAREVIDRQVTHMTRLIDDLLDVSRIANGKITLRKEEVNLTAVVMSAVEDHRPLLEANGLHLEFTAAERMRAFGDPARIAQVVSNMLVNANKFTDRTGRVSVELSKDGEHNAVITVRDTGMGMDQDTLTRIFEPFAQADRSIDRSRGGLGLGLALVKGLVNLHGGDVRATSAGLGQGSQFTVVLPILIREPMEATATLEGCRPPARSRRILIIEDNDDAAESMRMLLELIGHTVAVAHTGPEGLERAHADKPDVILCDIGLPGGMDGHAVARKIREHPELRSAYMVAMTGYGQDEDRKRALDAGFDHHLTKPADPDALERLLNR